MSTSKFLKKLTAAEVGNTNTHEVYIRIPNDFDYESFFNNTQQENGSVIEVNFTVNAKSDIYPEFQPKVYNLRLVHYINNANKEKRIPGISQLFRDFKVNGGDVVCLERIEKDNSLSFNLSFLSPDTIRLYNGALLLNGDIDTTKDKNTSINLDQPLQLIYYGAPGTGKSFTIDQVTNENNSVRTTFHPDSDYASFVGAYKPTMAPMPINAFVGTTVHHAKNAENEKAYEKKIVYKYVPQAFLKAYVEAWKRYSAGEDNPYYLVIEEINRGNCAQIFGDLFQILDRNNTGCSSYAISADEDIAQFLRDDEKGFGKLTEEQRKSIGEFKLEKDSGEVEEIGSDILNGSKLLLPPNLRIWATMNTSDQSLFPIDSAFKRRWNWKYMPIEYHPIDKKSGRPIDVKFKIGNNLYSWGQFLSIINPEIYTLTESSDKQMGYFFAKADPGTGVISEDVFLNKVLFYLWTDVFKDFDITDKLFRNEKENRSFRFTDFFDQQQPQALQDFIANLGLDIEDVDFDSISDDDSIEGEESKDNLGQRDFSRYSINGEGKYNKRQTVLRSLRRYVEANPSMSSAEVIKKWNEVNPQVPNFILSSPEYEQRVSELPGQRDRFWAVTTGTGEKVYITNQWNAYRITEFMNLVNNSDFGLHIEKVAE